MKLAFISCILLLLLIGCQDDPPPSPEPVYDSIYAGGPNFTTFVRGENIFGTQGKHLTSNQSIDFVVGNSLFRTNWVAAPASVKSLDGLGPVFNARSCGSCHFKDGRAAPADAFEIPRAGLLFRLSIEGNTPTGAPKPHRVYGEQLQDKSNPNANYEAKVNVQYEYIDGQYPDGTSYSLRKPIYSLSDLQFGPITEQYFISPRIAPQIPGLGLLESIDEDDILQHEDPDDSNNDGISGVANKVYDAIHKREAVGRFGWKAGMPSILQQNAGAFNGDMGLTSNIFPDDDWTDIQAEKYPDLIDGGKPEISDSQLYRITLYVQSLSVPAVRNVETAMYIKGKKLFHSVGCGKCHVESYTTRMGNDIAALDNQKISPYTDLLLHDMGVELSDQRQDFRASGQEWRTPPLWGIGLIPAVNKHTRYLHDGRARNIEEAILWHGGEGQKSREAFKELTKKDREDLIFFINSI